METKSKSPIQYLDQATGTLRELGITPARPDFTPINSLLEKISDLDKDRIAVISRTLSQTEVFNEVVRDQTQAMDIGRRYEDIAKAFNSIRDDAKAMVEFTYAGVIQKNYDAYLAKHKVTRDILNAMTDPNALTGSQASAFR